MGAFAEGEKLRHLLITRQNADGGWSYETGSSWTEPTAFAILALATQEDGEAHRVCRRAVAWLQRSQRADGGWAPQPGLPLSTWVSSLSVLALLQQGWRGEPLNCALTWLRGQVKPPASPLARLLSRMLGNRSDLSDEGMGTPWFPGTAAWLYPTSFAVLAFLRTEAALGLKTYGDLARAGQSYILSRRCRDGGWNHGGSRYLSEDAFSYPEMTGLALLALQGVPEKELLYPLTRAQTFLADPNSGEGLSWLELGLGTHHVNGHQSAVSFPCRTLRDAALRLLALNTGNARNFLIS